MERTGRYRARLLGYNGQAPQAQLYPLSYPMTLAKLLFFSMSQFSHLRNGDDADYLHHRVLKIK